MPRIGPATYMSLRRAIAWGTLCWSVAVAVNLMRSIAHGESSSFLSQATRPSSVGALLGAQLGAWLALRQFERTPETIRLLAIPQAISLVGYLLHVTPSAHECVFYRWKLIPHVFFAMVVTALELLVVRLVLSLLRGSKWNKFSAITAMILFSFVKLAGHICSVAIGGQLDQFLVRICDNPGLHLSWLTFHSFLGLAAVPPSRGAEWADPCPQSISQADSQ